MAKTHRGIRRVCAAALPTLLLFGCFADKAADVGDVTSAVSSDTNSAVDAAVDAEKVAEKDPAIAVLDQPSAQFWSSPFPDSSRVAADGTIALANFPNPTDAKIANSIKAMLGKEARGFGCTSGVFFPLTGAVDTTQLPDIAASILPTTKVFLAVVDGNSPYNGELAPIEVKFTANGGPFGAPNLLSLLPVQGIPLHPHTRYAAVVLRSVGDVKHRKLAAIATEIWSRKADVLDRLADANIPPDSIAGIAVFTTGDPTQQLNIALKTALGLPLPSLEKPFERKEIFPNYCVYESTLKMLDFQSGTPPYALAGGTWIFGVDGTLTLQRLSLAKIVVTVPRQKMPEQGFPLVILSRTGAGGDRPLVDRGVQAAHDLPALVPGSGPAMEYAAVGWAGMSVDGPLGGLRNPDHADEQFMIFNIQNLGAMRDNVRQSAVELALTAHIAHSLILDTSDCPGAPTKTDFDGQLLVLMGHSMGATIAPLATAFEPKLRGLLLSGAGGSYIENILWKASPITVLPIAEALLDLDESYHLHAHDPLLSLLQWLLEPSDPPVYGQFALAQTPQLQRHVLMMQGIVDTYNLPPMANAVSLSLRLDQGGVALDANSPDLKQFTPLAALLPLIGRQLLPLPASGNLYGKATGFVVQYPSDGIEDGHEAVFQTAAPKTAYRCFLKTLAATGLPVILPQDPSTICP